MPRHPLLILAGWSLLAPAFAQASADEVVARLPEYVVQGRQDDLTGFAPSASEGAVGAAELAERPLLRTGEILETIPGVIVTQHAGGGKANQYFTRGFNLDHGTDFAVDLDGVPLNLPTHAHGQGYADLNGVIPELIERIDFEKGPYYAGNGDFATVGAAHLAYAGSLAQPQLKMEAGTEGYARGVVAGSAPAGGGSLLYAAELYHDDGPWTVPDDYVRANGVARYGKGDAVLGFSVMAQAYHGRWNSTDQVAESAVASGRISFYGSQNPSDGGVSGRYSLQGEWHRRDAETSTRIMAYAVRYDLDLFSDFTYFLDSPKGDQFEQQDRRNAAGFVASRSLLGDLWGRKMITTFGVQLQDSRIDTGLYQTIARVRTDKVDYDGNAVPATTKVDGITEATASLTFDSQIHWADRMRSDLGLREDLFHEAVSDLEPVNSGSRGAGRASPKLSLIFGPWARTEIYVQGGYGFHSNDARGVTATVNPDGSASGTRLPLLVPARGGEIGLRTTAVHRLQSTLAFWMLRSDSELYFNGLEADSGQVSASSQPSRRYGVEFSNYYTPVEGLTFDLDYADSRAFFDAPTTADEDLTPGGTLVDEAIRRSLAAGVTVAGRNGWEASLRLRTFGPRPLTSDGSVTSASTSILNLGLACRLSRTWRLSCEVLNLLDRRDHDIDYYYTSRNSPAPGSPERSEIHFHPVEPIQFRFGLEAKL